MKQTLILFATLIGDHSKKDLKHIRFLTTKPINQKKLILMKRHLNL